MKKAFVLAFIFIIILVASMATAVFAWFSMSSIISIEGLSFTVNSTDGLFIGANGVDGWKNELLNSDLGFDKIGEITSITYIGGNLKDGEPFKQIKEGVTTYPDSYYKNPQLFTIAEKNVNYYFADLYFMALSDSNLYLDVLSYIIPSEKNEDEENIQALNKNCLAGAVRLAIFDEKGDCILVWAPNARYVFSENKKYIEETGTVENNKIYYESEPYPFVSTLGANLNTKFFLGELKEYESYKYSMALWIEGEDDLAQNALGGGKITAYLSFISQPTVGGGRPQPN